MKELKKGDHVEGKGYFSGYICKNCGREQSLHFTDGKNCQGDRRSINPSRLETVYEPNFNKPTFVKFVI